MKETKKSKIPDFQSLEEEREYWESRGPLAEGYKGKINKPRASPKRSSFLAVRLTGDELTRWRDIAARLGVGPSTLARLVITQAIEDQGKLPRTITIDEFKDLIASSLLKSVMDKAEEPYKNGIVVIDGSVITPEDERYEKIKEIMKT